jgi:hypothetical protein
MDHSPFPCLHRPSCLEAILLASTVVVVAAAQFCHTGNLGTIRNLVAHRLLYFQRLIASSSVKAAILVVLWLPIYGKRVCVLSV